MILQLRPILRNARDMDGNGTGRNGEADELRHAANNCRHMLQVMERKLADAERSLQAGEPDRCRQILSFLREAMPEAIAAIDPDRSDTSH
jgi:hypothetical protein